MILNSSLLKLVLIGYICLMTNSVLREDFLFVTEKRAVFGKKGFPPLSTDTIFFLLSLFGGFCLSEGF